MIAHNRQCACEQCDKRRKALIEAQKKIESFFMNRDKNIDRYGKPEVIACNRLRERKQFLNDYFLSAIL